MQNSGEGLSNEYHRGRIVPNRSQSLSCPDFPLRNQIPEMKGSDTLASKTWHIGMAMDALWSCPGLLSPESFGTRGTTPLAASLGRGS